MKKVRRSLILPLVLLACLIGFAGVHNPSTGGGSTMLSELTDTTITSPATGDLLRYDGTNWLNTSGSVDRGDPATEDLNQASMTLNDTYIDWDLSSIVPAGAVWVNLRVLFVNSAAGQQIRFRKNGNSNSYNTFNMFTQVAGVANGADGKVYLDSNRIIEYRASSSGAWTLIQVIVRGWGY